MQRRLTPAPAELDPGRNRRDRPRLGFLGAGWVGRNRLEAIAAAGVAEIAAVADPVYSSVEEIRDFAPGANLALSAEELLALKLDGLVIATPSALHAAQALAAFEQGLAVFCQKPLGRTAAETRQVVDAARAADRLLGVDLSYRYLTGMQAIRRLVRSGELGDIYAVDLVFHNAYGPDKPWFYDARLSGGGCVMDLGIHLADLALWTLDFPAVVRVDSRLFAGGRRLGTGRNGDSAVEDYAVAQIDLDNGATLNLACSWKLPAGRDAVIEATFYGRQGGASLRNVDGSFYDFRAERYHGSSHTVISQAPEAWSGRAAVAWARQLAADPTYDPAADRLVEAAALLDEIYRQGGCHGR
jgi:predicted dehydrogenase